MSAKKLGSVQNQPGISNFVGKSTEKTTKENSETTGVSKGAKRVVIEPGKKAKNNNKGGVKASTVYVIKSKKRSKPDNNSPDSDCNQPNKKKSTIMSNKNSNKDNNGGEIILKPELVELKRQLFAGFEELIEPLKKDIQDLKTERSDREEILNVETINRKFDRSDEKHKLLEERLSLIEDLVT